MMHWHRVLVVVSMLASCSAPPEAEHFEPGTFVAERPDADLMMRNWFSSHLDAMGEPPLHPSAGSSPGVIRVLYLRSFHHPISVRLQQGMLGPSLTAVELDGAGGYEPGQVVRRTGGRVSRDEWRDAIELLDNSGFWSLPTSDERPSIDGARWVLEAYVDGRYHVVQRSSSDRPDTAGYRGVCLWLLDIAAVTPVGDELY